VRAAEADLGAGAINPAQKKLLEDMVEKLGRLGRKNGKGFYDYTPGQPKRLWPGLSELLPKKLSREQVEALDVEELKQRFLVVQAVEAARTFEEKVVTDVREADVGSILGFGFAPYSGGTLSYIDMMGTKKFVELCRRFEKKYGARFTPPKLLIDLAEHDETFYQRFAPPKRKEAA
jgi:3-hydroxyacyl-CoA dehydrogenase/enoyl-CoA hydratase/3-hydroxybutyryl-CoA epimerase